MPRQDDVAAPFAVALHQNGFEQAMVLDGSRKVLDVLWIMMLPWLAWAGVQSGELEHDNLRIAHGAITHLVDARPGVAVRFLKGNDSFRFTHGLHLLALLMKSPHGQGH